MNCNYFDYRNMVEKLFYGVPLTDNHMNYATEQIRKYLVDGGAGEVVKRLGIGIRLVEKVNSLFPEFNEVIKRRFVFIDGERKGDELSIDEIKSIGMFLKYGYLYGKIK